MSKRNITSIENPSTADFVRFYLRTLAIPAVVVAGLTVGALAIADAQDTPALNSGTVSEVIDEDGNVLVRTATTNLVAADGKVDTTVSTRNVRAERAWTARLTAQGNAYQAHADRLAADAAAEAQAEAERAAAEQAAQEEAARVEAERLAAEQAEAERQAAEAAAAAEREAQRRAEAAIEDISETPKYATGSVNVRKGPGTGYAKVGSLSRASEIRVNGRASADGITWYRTTDGTWVSGAYLSDSKPAEEAPAPAAPAAPTAPAGDGGDVTARAEAEAARLGLRIVWDTQSIALDGVAHAGIFDWSTPDIIYVRPGQGSRTIAVVRHEAAHALIYRTCGGTTRPPITNGRHENVADAYGDLVLGGLSWMHYGYNAADADAARAIASGNCG